MPARPMHPDEFETDVSLVRRLLEAQLPQWASLPIAPVPSAGTDNAIYRLGQDMAVRLPRIEQVAGQIDKEHTWLPRLAPQLPLAVPLPLARGTPGEGFPWPWAVVRWLDGENATSERVADLRGAATTLAHFVGALQRIDPAGGPPPGRANFYRGAPLAARDSQTRTAIEALHGTLDTAAATAAWEAALAAPAWDRAPVWIHGDLQPGNLLAERGRITAAIDFGGLGVGDPACDLLVAWNLLAGEARNDFRRALRVDDATWSRGRGWALSVGLIGLLYYIDTNPGFVRFARHMIDEVLRDPDPTRTSE